MRKRLASPLPFPSLAKGLGELGNVGLNAAVANAVYHATGKRIRDLPVRIEKLIV